MPLLVARPPVIPLRSSTPVTALRGTSFQASSGHGDGLALLRGNLAHKAIELWFTSGVRPSLTALMLSLAEDHSDREIEKVAADVEAMLDLLDVSPLAQTLRRTDTESYFELPFSWDWHGAPVHGTVDLVYRRHGAWHLIDFKTDEVRGDNFQDAAIPYVPQLALYFLRPGAGIWPTPDGRSAVPQDRPSLHTDPPGAGSGAG